MSEHRPNHSGDDITRLLSAHVKQVIYECCEDPYLTASIVAHGFTTWEKAMRHAFAPYALPDEVIRRSFLFLCQHVVKTFWDGSGSPHGIEGAQAIATDVLDHTEVVPPPTDDEVMASFKLEDFSSEGYKRQFAEDHGMSPQEHFEKLIQQDRDDAKVH